MTNLKFNIIKKVFLIFKKENKKIIDIDGVRVMNKDGWWLVESFKYSTCFSY